MKKPSRKQSKPELSIVIVSYNTKKVLKDCLDSLHKVKNELTFQVILSDNGSSDGTLEMLKKQYKWVMLIENHKNLGFAKANNKAKKFVKSQYVLFLNSDTIVHKNTLKNSLSYIKENNKIGSLTCKVTLPSGKFDKDTIRSFPTPWVAFTHFSNLDRLFPHSKILSKYWYGYFENLDEVKKVDVVQGAFNLMPKKVLDKVKWFNQDYFLDGEDIDLCWKVKNAGYDVVYYPYAQITHVKKASKKGKKSLKTVMAGVNSMEIFYKKRLMNNYPVYINFPVLLGIKTMKVFRLLKYYLT